MVMTVMSEKGLVANRSPLLKHTIGLISQAMSNPIAIYIELNNEHE